MGFATVESLVFLWNLPLCNMPAVHSDERSKDAAEEEAIDEKWHDRNVMDESCGELGHTPRPTKVLLKMWDLPWWSQGWRKEEYTPIIILNQKKWQSETSWNIYKANDDSVTATCELLSNNWHEAFRLETNNVHQTRDFFQAIGVQKDPPPHKTPREISQETRITEDNLKVEENHQCIISNKRVSINLSSLNELKEMPFCQAYSVPEARPSKADKEPLLRLCDDSRRWWNLRPFSRGASGSTPMLPRWSQAMKLPNKPEAPPAMMNSCRLPWLATVTPNSKAI